MASKLFTVAGPFSDVFMIIPYPPAALPTWNVSLPFAFSQHALGGRSRDVSGVYFVAGFLPNELALGGTSFVDCGDTSASSASINPSPTPTTAALSSYPYSVNYGHHRIFRRVF
jgi:hypothetical protein